MMKNIGFYVTSNIKKIGPKDDILAFFQLVNELAVKRHPGTDWSLITDRFYKRYLKWEELEPASALMQRIKEVFTNIPTDKIDWRSLGIDKNTQLNLQSQSVAEVFERFFKSFKDFYGYALLWKKEDNTYTQPFRIIVAEIPECLKDEQRPLSDYDNLEGEPFWLR